MLSRVAAVMAPRTHNRRRVIGSSGRMREGGESEPQRSNMSRHLFYSAVLLLLVVMMCCSTRSAHAVESNLRDAQMPQWVDIFVSGKTQVLAKDGTEAGVKDSFGAASPVIAGGVMAVVTTGNLLRDPVIFLSQSDVLAGYFNPAWDWSFLVAKVSEDTWRAHTVFDTANETELVGVARLPTTIGKGNKVYLLLGSYEEKYDSTTKKWTTDGKDIKLIVGDARPSTGRRESGTFIWGDPTSLLQQPTPENQTELKKLTPFGGAGVLLENGTLVFSLSGTNEQHGHSNRIIYSTDDGANWVFPAGTPPAECVGISITEWENGQILMVTGCTIGRKVYESRDMGTTWTEAVGTLPGVWVNARSGTRWAIDLSVGSLITATIEEVKVMLYTHKRYRTLEKKEKALYLWITDNSRSFYLGPIYVESLLSETVSNTLLHSDGALYITRLTYTRAGRVISLARLTEELKTIRSTLSTWKKLDASFSESSTPTAGLVGFLSDEASGDTWIDGYRCVNANVTRATKVHNGFKFTGPGSKATWPVNTWEENTYYGFVNHDFTAVATVVIHQVPKGSTPLLGAGLGDGAGTRFIGLSYDANGKWETVFNGTTTASGSTWELGREYQVALMLQDGNKSSVYVDGVSVGSSETLPTPETRGAEITHFYIGGDEGDSDSSVTVTNFFLYNRPLSDDELKMVKKIDGSVRGDVSRVLMLLLLGLCGIAALY
ncbi:putative trans-sialidase, Group II [Trypanosoma cruzi]|uniref:Trans-sialidase, putative n=2 Tax=Trypanosoma cruzi TaxID=5693 RepID=Q4E026_TRYCC|nr:trans-sialidase, putative [Trypanosoma cruzi]EAN98115.1 trans-sialidase, putative [Trypanosoma cruzi]PWV00476.1 putative trans-sialidase, Group II [Trypanosoma cruzi]RNC46556.1 surface protein-2 [Trypanosoma cruzi]|eukprot:XP_819966.1 trans-sialidase [Trypanosoma cruzi strain CL Brener]